MSRSPDNESIIRDPAPSNATPSEDKSRMSLPSISNLLGIADASRPDANQAYESRSLLKRPRYGEGFNQQNTEANPAHIYSAQDGNHPVRGPHTRYSPTMETSQIGSTVPSYAMDVDPSAEYIKPISGSSQPTYETTSYSTKLYAGSPSAASEGYSPNAMMHRQIIYGSQGQPTGYAPPASQSSPNLPATNPWEHHHYISTSAQQGVYPPLPDRYICQTCNKAFSRPSSLKIHSHSHTGEKPFKCPHAGCGKAFSVKSNMKRHEKGCHTSTGQAIPGAYANEEG
ncbi:hypothetical protein AMS68_006681 [Peltaster fructicola]|uniref:C2H2-type domain-containing protein n=1 Tax=Peltaster fructicola TaxID=286661 RepID=A0A6H0Y2C5_9PEZI|nr:hypothetical protein AMS68_006681 [Peltaster fructicola]